VAYTTRGESLPAVVQALHAQVREKVLRWPGGAMRPRPVTLNTWEGTYFAHDVANLTAQATAAAALGIERFVLDDGWFGQRDDDTSSLGDWVVDRRKYPHGLRPLAEHVVGLGMEFGLWFEPEMVSPESELFREHPDWALQIAGRPLLLSRQQLVLDLSRPEVSEHLSAAMHAVLSSCPIGYIKWDMNRDLTHAGDAEGRAAAGRQTRAFYALVERIRAAHPGIEIESCASGGGRADYGALARTHRIWTSDCTDALERLDIQRGAGLFLPPEIMGAHVSASPNHQTGRRHSLAFRALVALPYHFGVELNPLVMDPAERAELAGWIALHKRYRALFHGGRSQTFAPVDGRHAHVAVARDGREAVLIVAQGAQQLREQPAPLRLPLDPGRHYRATMPGPQAHPPFVRSHPRQMAQLQGGEALSGAVLAQVGLALPPLFPESALLVAFTAVEE
jgi:alpha-galactosidase